MLSESLMNENQKNKEIKDIKESNININIEKITNINLHKYNNNPDFPLLDEYSKKNKNYLFQTELETEKKSISKFRNFYNNCFRYNKYNKEKQKYKEENNKLLFVKSLIKRYTFNKPLDGQLLQRQKFSLRYLINKPDEKEKSVSFEENKLCKSPYPLLKNLTNRYSSNNSKRLLIDMLSAKFNDLSKEQLNTLKKINFNQKERIKSAKREFYSNPTNSIFFF